MSHTLDVLTSVAPILTVGRTVTGAILTDGTTKGVKQLACGRVWTIVLIIWHAIAVNVGQLAGKNLGNSFAGFQIAGTVPDYRRRIRTY